MCVLSQYTHNLSILLTNLRFKHVILLFTKFLPDKSDLIFKMSVLGSIERIFNTRHLSKLYQKFQEIFGNKKIGPLPLSYCKIRHSSSKIPIKILYNVTKIFLKNKSLYKKHKYVIKISF